MELKLVKEMKKEENGSTFSRRDYTIADYKVIIEVANYDGEDHRFIRVRQPDESFLPHISFVPGIGTGKGQFVIGTVTFGYMTPEKFREYIAAQQTALEAAEILAEEFCK